MEQLKRIAAAFVGVVALGSGAAQATVPPEAPDPVDAFTLWSTANGLVLTRIACNIAEVVTCYGLDAAQATTTATMNPDGSFSVVVPAPAEPPAPTTAVADSSAGVGTRDGLTASTIL